jgi:acyl-CoA thioesterase
MITRLDGLSLTSDDDNEKHCLKGKRELTSFSHILAGIVPRGDSFAVSVTEDWRQGRTLYGGLSSALCVECAVRSVSALAPLRSAQFSFIGPAEGELRVVPSVLRRGKTAVFIAVDLFGESGLAVRATLCFGTSRVSALKHSKIPMPAVPGPEASEPSFADQSPYAFTRHFDSRLASGERPFSDSKVPEFTQWLQHKDAAAPDSAVALIALADVPPATVALFSAPSPISTITWMANILTDFPVGDDGWRLVESRADTILAGYSSQSLNIWSSTGKPLLASQQYIAVFV